ncbi:hypothetical protein PPK15_gp89 [Bacillus phage 000TH010]|uniref:Uncharacterized protein n=1 Tax=Bacillus phage 000TH010 TaxID=2601652 RepID=A0A5P8PHU7_9CAUD|nr:hypothetical protein PPK15_gp89 [Bacillus phage 000TH010]QFR56302.1 hypothetical protein 000TH010_89 [Bacillus phage 000TH010]
MTVNEAFERLEELKKEYGESELLDWEGNFFSDIIIDDDGNIRMAS